MSSRSSGAARSVYLASSREELMRLVEELYKSVKPRKRGLDKPRFDTVTELDKWVGPVPWHGRWLAASQHLERLSYGRRLGFGLLLLYGLQGSGKTVLSLIVAHELLAMRGRRYPMKRIIDEYLVFHPDELREKVRHASARRRVPVLIGDDWGITGSGTNWFEDREFYLYLRKLMQVVRTRIANMIVTAADVEAVARMIRGQPGAVIGLVRSVNKEYSVATYYELGVLPTGYKYVRKIGEDVFYVMMPDEIYGYYLERRDRYVDYVLDTGKRRLIPPGSPY